MNVYWISYCLNDEHYVQKQIIALVTSAVVLVSVCQKYHYEIFEVEATYYFLNPSCMEITLRTTYIHQTKLIIILMEFKNELSSYLLYNTCPFGELVTSLL